MPFACAFSRSHSGTRQGHGYIRYLRGRSQRGMSSQKSFLPSSSHPVRRHQITSYTQREDEALNEAWERFKDLLRLYPHHGLQKWMVV